MLLEFGRKENVDIIKIMVSGGELMICANFKGFVFLYDFV